MAEPAPNLTDDTKSPKGRRARNVATAHVQLDEAGGARVVHWP